MQPRRNKRQVRARRLTGRRTSVATVAAATALALLPAAAPAAGAERASSPPTVATAGSAASYISAPKLHPPKVSIAVSRPGRAGGDIFIDPFRNSAKPLVGEPGPLILDDKGNPIWFHPLPEGEEAVDFMTQTYRGKPVLTWWQGEIAVPPRFTNLPEGSPEPGARYYVYNQHYKRIATVRAQNGWTADLHEFTITPRGTALFIAYKSVPANLTPYGGPGNGQVEDAEIQEVSLKTHKLLFAWDMLKHVPLSAAEVAAPTRGIWDAYHMNSVQELPGGKLLVSARNTWAIYEISKKSGKVLWQIGGKNGSFKLPAQARFYWQHDARLQHGNQLSMFDDGCCNLLPTGLGPAEQSAHGLVLKLNFAKHKAALLRQYAHTPSIDVPSQGNVERLGNGNVFIGWGQLPYYSEYTSSGKLLYSVSLPQADESYRAFRLPWRGLPTSKPSAVALREGKHTTIYASWNGATEVKRWKVFAASSAKRLKAMVRSGKAAAEHASRGFQTTIRVRGNRHLYEVQAVASSGRALGTSRILIAARRVAAARLKRTASAFAGAFAARQTDVVHAGTVLVKLSCPPHTYQHCLASLTLRSRPLKLGERTQQITLGTGHLRLAPGRSAAMHVKLSNEALHALEANGGRLMPHAIVKSEEGRHRHATRTTRITIEAEHAHKEEVSALY